MRAAMVFGGVIVLWSAAWVAACSSGSYPTTGDGGVVPEAGGGGQDSSIVTVSDGASEVSVTDATTSACPASGTSCPPVTCDCNGPSSTFTFNQQCIGNRCMTVADCPHDIANGASCPTVNGMSFTPECACFCASGKTNFTTCCAAGGGAPGAACTSECDCQSGLRCMNAGGNNICQ